MRARSASPPGASTTIVSPSKARPPNRSRSALSSGCEPGAGVSRTTVVPTSALSSFGVPKRIFLPWSSSSISLASASASAITFVETSTVHPSSLNRLT